MAGKEKPLGSYNDVEYIKEKLKESQIECAMCKKPRCQCFNCMQQTRQKDLKEQLAALMEENKSERGLME